MQMAMTAGSRLGGRGTVVNKGGWLGRHSNTSISSRLRTSNNCRHNCNRKQQYQQGSKQAGKQQASKKTEKKKKKKKKSSALAVLTSAENAESHPIFQSGQRAHLVWLSHTLSEILPPIG